MMAANPTSETELQLYRVLQRANLLQYFDTFISQGGDDVEQLCEAGEEEFLEIMALVGMASKPLHVRRLQKALQEWVGNPTVFHQPLGSHTISPPIAAGSILASVQRPYLKMVPTSISTSTPQGILGTPLPTMASLPSWSTQEVVPDAPTVTRSSSPSSSVMDGIYSDSLVNNGSVSGQTITFPVDSPPSGATSCTAEDQTQCLSPNGGSQHHSLTEGQLKALENSAADLAKTLPRYQPKPLNMKKLINKEIEVVMKLPSDHPERMDLLRKYGAIYGRFDSQRKNEKILSLHEVSVNEAAAQLCRYHVALLTRRNDLFPLARQVVRDSGYQYSKGHSRGQSVDIAVSNKRRIDPYSDLLSPIKIEPGKSMEQKYRELRMSAINRELSDITVQLQSSKVDLRKADDSSDLYSTLKKQIEALSAKQIKLLTEQSELLHKHRTHKRSEINSALKLTNKGDSDEDDNDEDSIPFPSDGPDAYSPHTSATMVTEVMKTEELSGQSLLNEGLRIAEQYGMADFATEIKELGLCTGQSISIKKEVTSKFFKTQESPVVAASQIDATTSRIANDADISFL